MLPDAGKGEGLSWGAARLLDDETTGGAAGTGLALVSAMAGDELGRRPPWAGGKAVMFKAGGGLTAGATGAMTGRMAGGATATG